jgi:hypothetical protein
VDEPRPRDWDRGRQDLFTDPGTRDLREDPAERDVHTDLGSRDLIRDLGAREAVRLGIRPSELRSTEARIALEPTRSGGFRFVRGVVETK